MKESRLSTFSSNSYTFTSLSKTLRSIYSNLITDKPDHNGMTAIMLNYAIVQGYLSQLFIEHIRCSDDYRESQRNSNLISFSLLHDLIINPEYRLEKIQSNFKILNVNFQDIDQSNWNAIIHLRNIRNVVAHGATISYDEVRNFQNNENEILYSKFTLKDTFEFLNKQEKISFNLDEKSYDYDALQRNFQLFRVDVINYFLRCSQEFIINLIGHPNIKENLSPNKYIKEFLSIDPHLVQAYK